MAKLSDVGARTPCEECARPAKVAKLDPRATFRDGPYQARMRHPLRPLASKPFAVACIEQAPEA